MLCSECGKKIPKKRLKALPDTTTCVKCSKAKAVVGITVWDKTTPELVISDEEEAKQFRRMERFDGRLERL